MRLLDTLIKKRDFHLAQAGKFSELIAVLENDDDLSKQVHQGKLSVVNGAARNFAAVMAARTAPEPKPKSKTRHSTPAYKKAMSKRMKKLWKTQREKMMAGVKKGNRNAIAARAATT